MKLCKVSQTLFILRYFLKSIIYSMEKINNIQVKPVRNQEGEGKKAKGYKLFMEPYSNIFCLARKKSGKTTVIYEILRRCTSPKTKIVFICSTVNKDFIYREMVRHFKKRGNIKVAKYTALKEDGMNVIDLELDKLGVEEDEIIGDVPDEKYMPKPKHFLYFGKEEKKEKSPDKPRPSKYIAPEVVFILDDLGTGLRDKSVSDLLKKNRHYKSRVIMSSQYMNDLKPEAIKQLDYMLIFPGQSEDKLQLVYKHLDLALEYDYFLDKYHKATAERYSFLYVDAIDDTLRKNFDKRFV